MSTPNDFPTVVEMSFVETETLEERLTKNPGYAADIATMKNDVILEAGFTITDLQTWLPPQIGSTTETRSVIGWTFGFPPFSTNPGAAMLISDIVVTELLIEEAAGGAVRVSKNVINCEINPKIFGSLRGIQPTFPIDYQNAYDQIRPFMLNDPGLHISRLEGYKNWAELAFISRTELDLMRILLEDSNTDYNQYFFTGAHAEFIKLHNPEYIMRSENFVGKYTNTPVSSTNQAFTLKAEPFVENSSTPGANKSTGNTMANAAPGSGRISVSGDGASSIPVIPLMTPCPEIWILEEGLYTSLKTTAVGLEGEDINKLVKFMTAPAERTATIMLGSESSFPVNTTTSREPDFFDRLRDLYQAIRRLFTNSGNV